MARTSFATGNNLTKKVWEERLFRDSLKESYFTRFAGEGPDNIVDVKTQLEKGQGDKINFGIRMRATGPGVTSGTTLEGNEESLTTYSSSVTLEQYRHAIRDDGDMSRKRAMFEVTAEQEAAIKDWMGEKIDKIHFDTVGVGSGATSDPTKIFYKTADTGTSAFLATGTAATAKAALSATLSLITLNFIAALRSWAKTGGNRAYVPLRPVKVDGRSYYVLLVHPDVMYDLKSLSSFQQAMREAEIRGPENPLFKGSTAIWDNVVIHEHENCTTGTDGGGASVSWTKAVLLGAQSLVWAWGKRPEVITRDFDYGNEIGNAVNMIAGCAKPQFNSLDYGSLGVYFARTNISGT